MIDDGRRFFDTRAAYIMFATTTGEKAAVAERVADELVNISPSPPGLRLFDAGMGDASVLSSTLRRMHRVFPHVPWTVVGKEISVEDVRLALGRLPDRLFEHPELVFVVTNMTFTEATRLQAKKPDDLVWREVALEGETSDEFASQIRGLYPQLATDWRVRTSPNSGNPVYEHPTVLVLYRSDHEFLLRSSIPQRDAETPMDYDLAIAAQAYRAQTAVDRKVRLVIDPLAKALAPGGRLVVVQGRGGGPGLDIIRGVWPEEDPFPHDRFEVIAEARRQLSGSRDLRFNELSDSEAIIRYEMHAMPSESVESIGTSSILATWNAAAYVAQIDEARLSEAMRTGAYEPATRHVMEQIPNVWFEDEMFIISREP